MIRVGIADDHDLMRKGIMQVLQQDPDIEVILEASDGQTLLQHEHLPLLDILLLDLRMPGMDGLQVVQKMQKDYPSVALLIISSFNEPFQTEHLFDLGIKGYLVKGDNTAIHLPEAIRNVQAGLPYLSEEALQKKLKLKAGSLTRKAFGDLSYQHLELIKLAAQGYTEDQMAAALYTTRVNITKQKKRIMQVFQRNTFQEVISYCIGHGVIEVD